MRLVSAFSSRPGRCRRREDCAGTTTTGYEDAEALDYEDDSSDSDGGAYSAADDNELSKHLVEAAAALALPEMRAALEAGATRRRRCPPDYSSMSPWSQRQRPQSCVLGASRRIGGEEIDVGHLQVAALRLLDEYAVLHVDKALSDAWRLGCSPPVVRYVLDAGAKFDFDRGSWWQARRIRADAACLLLAEGHFMSDQAKVATQSCTAWHAVVQTSSCCAC